MDRIHKQTRGLTIQRHANPRHWTRHACNRTIQSQAPTLQYTCPWASCRGCTAASCLLSTASLRSYLNFPSAKFRFLAKLRHFEWRRRYRLPYNEGRALLKTKRSKYRIFSCWFWLIIIEHVSKFIFESACKSLLRRMLIPRKALKRLQCVLASASNQGFYTFLYIIWSNGPP